MAHPGRLVQRVAQRLKAQVSWHAAHRSVCSASCRIAAGATHLCRLIPSPQVSSRTGTFSEKARTDVSSGSLVGAPAIAHPVANADVLPVVMFCGALAASGAYIVYLAGSDGAPLEVKGRLKAEDFVYVCEGAASVLCAYVGTDPEWRGCLLQVVKEPIEGADKDDALDALRLRAELPHLLAKHCFQPHVVDRPQLVSLPEDDIRELDAHIFTGRPAGRRNQRLLSTDASGSMVALRFRDIFEGPPAMKASTFGSMFGAKPVQLMSAPLLTVDLRPGCGLQEVQDLPSRDILRACAALGNSKRLLAADPVALFSGDAAKAAATLRARLEVFPSDDTFRIYLDGKPLYPTQLPDAVGGPTAKEAPQVDSAMKSGQHEGCLPSTTDDLLTALGSVLAAPGQTGSERGVMSDLRLLQCYAAGEDVEKMAERLWQDFQKHAGPEATTALKSVASLEATVAAASRKRVEKERRQAQEREGRKLMALKDLSKRQEVAVRDWLALFLLGRAAFDAHVLVNFAHVNSKVASDSAMQSHLREYRFLPLKDIVPDRDWSANVWFRVTVLDLGRREPAGIPKFAAELEECVNRYREMSAAKG